MAQKTQNTSADEAAAPDLVEVKIVRKYVPFSADYHVQEDDVHKGTPRETRILHPLMPGTVVKLPREEARRAIREAIAVIDQDLI